MQNKIDRVERALLRNSESMVYEHFNLLKEDLLCIKPDNPLNYLIDHLERPEGSQIIEPSNESPKQLYRDLSSSPVLKEYKFFYPDTPPSRPTHKRSVRGRFLRSRME